MISIIPTFGTSFGRAAKRAAHRIGIIAVASGRRPPDGIRDQATRIALLVAVITAIAAMGTDAPAAVEPSACDTAGVVARTLSAVVNITAVKVVRSENTPAGKPVAATAAGMPTEDTAAGKPTDEHITIFVGSGAVIDPSGIIVTNKHAIQDAAMIRVIFHDKTEVSAQLIAAANFLDLALLKVERPAAAADIEVW